MCMVPFFWCLIMTKYNIVQSCIDVRPANDEELPSAYIEEYRYAFNAVMVSILYHIKEWAVRIDISTAWDTRYSCYIWIVNQSNKIFAFLAVGLTFSFTKVLTYTPQKIHFFQFKYNPSIAICYFSLIWKLISDTSAWSSLKTSSGGRCASFFANWCKVTGNIGSFMFSNCMLKTNLTSTWVLGSVSFHVYFSKYLHYSISELPNEHEAILYCERVSFGNSF